MKTAHWPVEEREEAQRRCHEATDGPWKYGGCEDRTSSKAYDREGYIQGPKTVPIPDTVSFEPADAEFMAHAREDLPRALDHIARLEGLIAATINASDNGGGSASDAIQDMLSLLHGALGFTGHPIIDDVLDAGVTALAEWREG